MNIARKITRNASKAFIRGNRKPVAIIDHFAPKVLDKYALGIKRDAAKAQKAEEAKVAESKEQATPEAKD